MRLLETTRTVAEAATHEQLSPPPGATTRHPACDPQVHDCRWWPYSDSGEFGPNAAMVVIILLCALICALALNAAVRCFLRATSNRRGPSPPSSRSHHVQEIEPSSAMVFSSGMMVKLNECPICLSEFVEGERVRVLERCKHGFHARCIDTWLSGQSSCPTCRATCFILPPPPPPPNNNSSPSAAGERGCVGGRDEDRESGRVDVDCGPPTSGM